MSTKGKKWTRKDRKWTEEIMNFVKSVCPLREHGFSSRRELAEEINRRFCREFTDRALCTHCYDNGIQLGLCNSNSDVPRGEKHWRHRPVGSFQEKKGYIRIKVAEPNKWMQYQRYVWEQNHPGQSAEGKTVIFMDGNIRNFDPSNLECVERAELSVMAELGCTAACTKEERELYLLRARLLLAKSTILGAKEAAKRHNKMNYERRKNDPEFKAKCAAYAKQRMAEIMADPVRHQEYLEKQRAYREKNRERINQWANERRAYLKENEPDKYMAKLLKERARHKKEGKRND
ncbi:HNH endonuclease [Succinivibrio sp.]|uniref:HNH endonuclease n=1 Tax=Succinivibrio sp. TaxID=2053619 RepID=UPI00386BA7FC